MGTTKEFKPNSIKKDIQRYNRHILSYWYTKDFNTLCVKDIILYRQYLTKQKLSPQSIKHCLSLLRRVLNRAIQLEILSIRLPYFEMPIINNARVRFLTEQEVSLLLSTLMNKSELWHDISLFALHTGMRAGEIFDLQAHHFNLYQNLIILYDTKNNQIRTIPLNNIALSIAKKYLAYNMQYLFSEKKLLQVSKIFRTAVKETNLNKGVLDTRNKVVFYTLRHTFASWLIQKGISLPVVSNLLGHKDLKMTMRYAHLAPDQGKYAVDRLVYSIK